MPRYFFNTEDGARVLRDDRGTVLADADDAIHEARKLAFDLFYGAPIVGRTVIACSVQDEVGAIVYHLRMDISGENRHPSSPSVPKTG